MAWRKRNLNTQMTCAYYQIVYHQFLIIINTNSANLKPSVNNQSSEGSGRSSSSSINNNTKASIKWHEQPNL